MSDDAPQPRQEQVLEPVRDSGLRVYALLVVFVAVCVFVIFAVRQFMPTEAPTLTYNFFTFTQQEGFWYTQWQNGETPYTIGMRYSPTDVEAISVVGALDDAFNDEKEVYVVIDANATPCEKFKYLSLAAGDLGFALKGPLQRTAISACWSNASRQCNPAEPVNACADYPIVTCEDQNKSVILLVPEGDASILAQGRCLVLKGEGMEIIRAVDRFLYMWYGIMPSGPRSA